MGEQPVFHSSIEYLYFGRRKFDSCKISFFLFVIIQVFCLSTLLSVFFDSIPFTTHRLPNNRVMILRNKHNLLSSFSFVRFRSLSQ